MTRIPTGDKAREATDALSGYVYQIYQSALAWIELEPDEYLLLEVAEDYAVVAKNALKGVQVKKSGRRVTINSDEILASIDSFVHLALENTDLQVELHHLTTATVGKERSAVHRVGDTPTLELWRRLAKAGDVEPLRTILGTSRLSKETKDYISALDDSAFREKLLRRIHFECGALDSKFLVRRLRSKLTRLLMERGGLSSQVDGCLSSMVVALLRKASEDKDRFVDRTELEGVLQGATHIAVNRAQFETQSALISKALTASVPQGENPIATRVAEPRPIDEVPIPSAIASRTRETCNIVGALIQCGVCWIFGGAGVGKTLGAKIAARQLGGHWASINLRGLGGEQVKAVLTGAVDKLAEQSIDGYLIDDLECPFEPYVVDELLYLRAICDRTDSLLIFISPRPPSSDFLFLGELPAAISQKFADFSEEDIQEILTALDVRDARWARYIYLVSGGGHPQLAVAAIQSMQSKCWDTKELDVIHSLREGNSEVEQVRARTRERLLEELPESSRRLLERLSLKSGSFRRNFVLDMAQLAPRVPDGGIVLDRLVGSWVDQQELDRFALSPLLSNLAVNSLDAQQQREIHVEIANSLIKERSLDPLEANSALFSAWRGKNGAVIVRLCAAVLGAEQRELETIAPYLTMFTLLRTDSLAYEEDPVVSQMFRGAQAVLMCHTEERAEKIQEVLECFAAEGRRIEDDASRSLTSLLVYAKVLLSTPKCGALPRFFDLVSKLEVLLTNKDGHLPPVLMRETATREVGDVPMVGFMFLNQAMQIKLIDELLATFEFLDSCGHDLRRKLLKPLDSIEFAVDMLVAGAWLREHKTDTIDPPRHSHVFARLEEFAKSWNHVDLAVCCRKYRAVIIDEYGNDKDRALAVLEEGLTLYGQTNSQLVREKAKVLWRAEDHRGSLQLSKTLIEGGAPLSEIEKAFLGRDAAISAEKEGQYETARRYYFYGSEAARQSAAPDMVPMRVGLLADAALAGWRTGDRAICLREFCEVLQKLKELDPSTSLRAAHCHATCRHVLLWLDQDATGEKRLLADGEETKIYPGIVSNPEPHPQIGERHITPIEMAWYMLAVVENHSCLDIGITQNLVASLPGGEVLEGAVLLTPAKIAKAVTLLDPCLLTVAVAETTAQFTYFKEHGGYRNSLDVEHVTYGTFPTPSAKQQAEMSEVSEQFVLCFVANSILAERTAEVDRLIGALEEDVGCKVRSEFLGILKGTGSPSDFNTSAAALLASCRYAIDTGTKLLPVQVFELGLKAVQIAGRTNTIRIMAKPAFEWLCSSWTVIWQQQRFLLTSPAVHKEAIERAREAESNSWIHKAIDLLIAILPAIGPKNEADLSRILDDIRRNN